MDLVLVDAAPEIAITGEMHGFGLPTSTMTTRAETVDTGIPTARFEIVQDGLFTDLDASVRIELPVEGLERVIVRVGRGKIRVIDRTRDGIESTGRPVLDLETGYGRVVSTPHSTSLDMRRRISEVASLIGRGGQI